MKYLLALLMLCTPCLGQVVIDGNRISVGGKPVIGLNDCLSSIVPDGGLGFDGGCRRAAGDCDGPDSVGEKFVPLSAYSKAYKAAGFNTFRVQRGGACNPADPEVLAPYMQTLKSDGWTIWFNLYDVSDPIFSLTPQQAAIVTKNLVQRLSPYVDIWEIGNEASPSVALVQAIADAIRQNDPLHRPISTSWNDASYAFAVDINSPHQYFGPDDIPTALHNSISFEYSKMPGKPIVYGEIGNTGQNWSHQNVAHIHDFVATALAEGVGLLFWNTSNSKDYQNAAAANIYLGPEERAEVLRLVGGVAVPPAPRHLPTIPTQKPRKPCWLIPGMCQ
jgi:hypothetical protein